MGLYDFLQYEGKTYQFKDFDPFMHTYEITPEKRLIRKSRFKIGDTGYLEYESVSEDTNYHGDIYSIIETGDDEYAQYRFRFTGGELVSVEEIKEVSE